MKLLRFGNIGQEQPGIIDQAGAIRSLAGIVSDIDGITISPEGLAKIRALACPNVTLLGYQPFDVLHDHLQRAKGFVFAAEEDFGISPVEAQACGKPVIAFRISASSEWAALTGISLAVAMTETTKQSNPLPAPGTLLSISVSGAGPSKALISPDSRQMP